MESIVVTLENWEVTAGITTTNMMTWQGQKGETFAKQHKVTAHRTTGSLCLFLNNGREVCGQIKFKSTEDCTKWVTAEEEPVHVWSEMGLQFLQFVQKLDCFSPWQVDEACVIFRIFILYKGFGFSYNSSIRYGALQLHHKQTFMPLRDLASWATEHPWLSWIPAGDSKY